MRYIIDDIRVKEIKFQIESYGVSNKSALLDVSP